VSTPAFRLEPLSGQHLDAVAQVVLDPQVRRFTRFPEPPDPDFPAVWIARYARGRDDGTCDAFAAVDDDGVLLGTGMAPHIDRDARQMELGYLVAPAARGRGVGSEILRRLTRWALDDVQALRVYLLVAVENVGSQRVAERAGYIREGVLRSMHLKGEERGDTIVYSRLPSDDGPRPL
jgi:RimJ/RimL family protein N-acetyltransferase